MKTFARNKADLAQKLKISRPTLYRFFEMKGHPKARTDGRWLVGEWKRFVAAHATKIVIPDMPLSEREKLAIERIALSIRKEQLALDIERGERIAKAEIVRVLDTANVRVKDELYRAMKIEIPARIEGMSLAKIAKVVRRKIDHILRGLPSPFLAKA
jgi:hypothetical protein